MLAPSSLTVLAIIIAQYHIAVQPAASLADMPRARRAGLASAKGALALGGAPETKRTLHRRGARCRSAHRERHRLTSTGILELDGAIDTRDRRQIPPQRRRRAPQQRSGTLFRILERMTRQQELADCFRMGRQRIGVDELAVSARALAILRARRAGYSPSKPLPPNPPSGRSHRSRRVPGARRRWDDNCNYQMTTACPSYRSDG